MNDGINKALCSLTYLTVWGAAQGIMEKGAGALIAKVDIQHAYHNVPVHPTDWALLGTIP